MNRFLPPMERLAFREGQTLRSCDLRRAQENDLRLHALHNRYVHATWGISLGLSAAITSNRLAVTIQPGYAIDTFGEDILLLQEVTLPAPRLTQAQVLAVAASSGGICEWWSARDLVIGPQVLLAAAFVSNGVISGAIDLSVRRYARSLAVPRLVAGTTQAGRTGWADAAGSARWIEAAIDTTDADFVTSPQYFASLNANSVPLAVVSTGPRSFVARVAGTVTAKQAEAEAWTVSWIGIESEGLL